MPYLEKSAKQAQTPNTKRIKSVILNASKNEEFVIFKMQVTDKPSVARTGIECLISTECYTNSTWRGRTERVCSAVESTSTLYNILLNFRKKSSKKA